MQSYLELLQGYYKFLSLGKFFEYYSKQQPLSSPPEIPIVTGDHTKFAINTTLVSGLLAEIHKHPTEKNVYGYIVEISAFRWIFSIMREMIEKDSILRSQLQLIFQDQYLPFEQTIRFLRNVLSHTSTTFLYIQQEDYQKQKEFLLMKSIKSIHLDFRYSDYLPEWKGSKDYSCQVSIDFSKLRPATSLRKIVSVHQMYVLAELCYNITKVLYQRTKKTASKEKNITQKKTKSPSQKKKKSPIS